MQIVKLQTFVGTVQTHDLNALSLLGEVEPVAFYIMPSQLIAKLKPLTKLGNCVHFVNQWASAKTMYQWCREAAEAKWFGVAMVRQEWRENEQTPVQFYPLLFAEAQCKPIGRPLVVGSAWRKDSLVRGEIPVGRIAFRDWNDEEALSVLLGRYHQRKWMAWIAPTEANGDSCGVAVRRELSAADAILLEAADDVASQV